jgi:hypothetical protein
MWMLRRKIKPPLVCMMCLLFQTTRRQCLLLQILGCSNDDVEVDEDFNITHKEEDEEILDLSQEESSIINNTPTLLVTKKLKSWVWEHFSKMTTKGECLCKLCKNTVCYSLSYSTNMLACYLECSHPRFFRNTLVIEQTGLLRRMGSPLVPHLANAVALDLLRRSHLG